MGRGPILSDRVRTENWPSYLRSFHAERSGVTETILDQALLDGRTPYHWLADVVEGHRVLDLACGSAPMAILLHDRLVAATDVSVEELAVASRRLPGRVAQARAEQCPVRTGSVDTVVCSMAMMLMTPIAPVTDEIVRVLAPGGSVAALLPAISPLDVRDRVRYARLLVAVRRRRIPFPSYGVVARGIGSEFERVGLHIERNDRARFRYAITDDNAADDWLGSLYLPGTNTREMERGRRIARRWVGTELGIPLRRVVARLRSV